MNIVTRNPIIVGGKRVSQPSKYLSFDASTATKSQIMDFQTWAVQNKVADLKVDGIAGDKTKAAIKMYGNDYDNRFAPKRTTTSTPTATEVAANTKKGLTYDKALNAWVKAKDSGLLDKAKGLLGLGGAPTETGGDMPLPEEEEKKWSTGAKVGVAVGGALVLGLIIYAVTRKK
jgi:hypothetical protein